MTDPGDARLSSPAALRNRQPIAAVLHDWLPTTGHVLEIASGTGEHVAWFAAAMPNLTWQPSDPSPDARASIDLITADQGLTNVRPAIDLDAARADWPVDAADAVLCINMVHISPWPATLGLCAGAARILTPGGPLILYGPFLEDGVETAPSNLAFDQSLKDRNPAWGLRHLNDVDRVAAEHGFARVNRTTMPANNLTLVYRMRMA